MPTPGAVNKCDDPECGAEIRWEKSEKTGKWVPINIATGRSHFLDCPGADKFTGRNRR